LFSLAISAVASVTARRRRRFQAAAADFTSSAISRDEFRRTGQTTITNIDAEYARQMPVTIFGRSPSTR